ncbi:MAG TPA: M48 family metallopeptidase [Stellaceae bacterium]|nr:M48 family metallopeptidase [Stellaceae bacterium]
MALPGRYHDGLSTAAHEVRVAFDDLGGHLVIAADGAELARWPYADIRAIEKPLTGQSLRLRLDGDSGARLAVAADLYPELRRRCQVLHWRGSRERRATFVAMLLVAAFAGLALTVFLVVPRFAHQIAMVIPARVERRIGDATEITVMRILGLGHRAKVCSEHDGKAVMNRLAGRLAKAAGLPSTPKVEVVKSPIVNAFALPGDHVIVLSQLIDEAPDGNAVAGVLGHEFGHIAHRDPLEMMVRQSSLSLLVGVMVGDVYGGSAIGGAALAATNAAHSRAAEQAADEAAVQTLNKAGIDPKGFAQFFDEIGRKHGNAAGGVPAFLMTHPDPGERVAMIEREGKPGKDALTADEWQSLKGICGERAADDD